MQEKICERKSCSKKFQTKEFSLKKYCSQKCRIINWALRIEQKENQK